MGSSSENKCGVEGCIALHDEPSPIWAGLPCRCRGDYLCSRCRSKLERHLFPKLSKEDEPWFCDLPRRTPCQYPYCDCGRQGGPFG